MMLTNLKLRKGEGKLVVAIPQASSRRAHLPQVSPQVSPNASLIMTDEGKPNNMTEEENTFRNFYLK